MDEKDDTEERDERLLGELAEEDGEEMLLGELEGDETEDGDELDSPDTLLGELGDE